jgi:hypothetical protein
MGEEKVVIFLGGWEENASGVSYPQVVGLIQLIWWDMLNHHYEVKVVIPILSILQTKQWIATKKVDIHCHPVDIH